jgi:hypothetical protein
MNLLDDDGDDDDNLDRALSSLKHIGGYLESGFQERSFWPPESSHRFPIYNKRDLVNFVKSRGGKDTQRTRARLTEWLKNVLINVQSEECIDRSVMINGVKRNYKVRYSNFLGYNAIIDFLRQELKDTSSYRKIPFKMKQLSLHRKFPCP